MSKGHVILPVLLAIACGAGMAGAAAISPDFYTATDGWDVKSKYVFASSDDYTPAMALYGDHEQTASECARILDDGAAGELDTNWCAEYAGFISGNPDAASYIERTAPLEAGAANIITLYDPGHIDWYVKWSICSVTPAPSENPDTVIECTAVIRVWTAGDGYRFGAGVFEW